MGIGGIFLLPIFALSIMVLNKNKRITDKHGLKSLHQWES